MEIISRKEALEKGLKLFFDGRTCKHGHVCEWYAKNSNCMLCTKERSFRNKRKYRGTQGKKGKSEKPRRATIPGARFIAGRCDSGSP